MSKYSINVEKQKYDINVAGNVRKAIQIMLRFNDEKYCGVILTMKI
jgi:hypothetical protein